VRDRYGDFAADFPNEPTCLIASDVFNLMFQE
jgi:hypothetical protein